MIGINFNKKELIYFDVETCGLTFEKEFICATTYNPKKDQVVTDKNLYELRRGFTKSYYIENGFEKDLRNEFILVTYNGENYKTGFDFPFLRTKFALNNLEWCFQGWEHLDIYPLIKKHFNHKFEKIKPPSRNNLYAKDLKKLAKLNNIEYINADKTYEALSNFKDTNWGEFDLRITNKDKFDEQSLYQTFFDPECKEEYIDGSEISDLYEKGKIDKIIDHNKRDVIRLYKLTNLLLDYIPQWEIDRNIKTL